MGTLSTRAPPRAAAVLSVFLTASGDVMPAAAQVLYGSVVGVVTDPSEAAVAGAAVTLTNKQTGQSREALTDDNGRYSLINILPGTYDLKVEAKGFRVSARLDIPVSPDTVGRVDVKLEVGQITEQIMVEATAVAPQTDKSDSHSEIQTKAITSLPLSNYRNYQTLINLVPGASPAAFQNSITDTPGRALATHINGGNAQTNITRIDGATSVNVWLPHHVGYVEPEENIEVVNVTTGAADAEQGLAGASAITVVTKSGTNEVHGSAYEFHDDQHLKARNFFQAAGTDKPLSVYNDFGATVGGPIRRNRLFYFLSYDGTRQRQGGPAFYTVPTAVQRVGDFTEFQPCCTILPPGIPTEPAGCRFQVIRFRATGWMRSRSSCKAITRRRISPARIRTPIITSLRAARSCRGTISIRS